MSATPREHQVMEQLSKGLQNKIIAANLGVSEHTVRKIHLHRIIRKLGAPNRTGAAAIYLERFPDFLQRSGVPCGFRSH